MVLIDRIWSMPNSKTFSIKPIKELLEEEIQGGIWLDPFARDSKIATITNDLNTEFETDFHLEATEFLKLFPDNYADVFCLIHHIHHDKLKSAITA